MKKVGACIGTSADIKAVGTRADISGKVEIGKVFGGYFSNPANAQAFVDLGVKPIFEDLPKSIKYSDFGGGDGYLGKFVADFLKKHGKKDDILRTLKCAVS